MDKFGQELIEALSLYGVVELVSHGIPNVSKLSIKQYLKNKKKLDS